MALTTSSEHSIQPIVHHSLTDAGCSINVLQKILESTNLTLYKFESNVRMGYYSFDFFCSELHLAIEIESYSSDLYILPNREHPKKLYVASLGIYVLRFTDYQILTDKDEILRLIKRHINREKQLTFA